jgi:hypothetical protein
MSHPLKAFLGLSCLPAALPAVPHVPIHIDADLEDFLSSVVEASTLHITYKAYDHAAALAATASLLAKGRTAQCFSVARLNQVHWYVDSSQAAQMTTPLSHW